MKLAASNIAWTAEEDENIADLLRDSGFEGVEIAPTRVWPDLSLVTESNVIEHRKFWNDRGLSVVALQALLYGQPLQMFAGGNQDRMKILDYLERVFWIGGLLGAKIGIFGSPKCRIRGEMPKETADEIAIQFFDQLGERAKKHDFLVGLETLGSAYKSDYLTTVKETQGLLEKISSSNICLHMDCAALSQGAETIDEIAPAFEVAKHYHISEPALVPIGEGGSKHNEMVKCLNSSSFSGWRSVEMIRPADNTVVRVKKSFQLAAKIYGDSQSGA